MYGFFGLKNMAVLIVMTCPILILNLFTDSNEKIVKNIKKSFRKSGVRKELVATVTF